MKGEVDYLDAAATLAERIREGDSFAEEELIARFHRRVLLMAWARARDSEAAVDLAQETMLAVLTALRNGKLIDADRLPGFVRGTAKNLINNHLRGEKQVHQAPDPALPQPGLNPEELAGQAERMDQVRQALAELRPADRQILLLTLTEGLTPREIAERLGLGPDVVRKRKSRALARLRETMRKRSQK
jgi:RNA polymerase sigma-70 factor (ECF subfamily)